MTRADGHPGLTIDSGHTLLLDESQLERHHCLTVQSGLVRVAISRPEHEALQAQAITLGFLQAGDHLSLDLLRHTRLHLQALWPTRLLEGGASLPPAGSTSLHDWTLGLLLIRHLGDAEQRILALLQLLVKRLGQRCGAWYELPLRLTHAELAELSGHTRATVTRQLSRWREQGLIGPDVHPEGGLRLAPELVESLGEAGPFTHCCPI
jgi:hypothetical protein